ncbi:MAG: hypothetical protein JJE45_00330 [Prolixibacteraceae bacterium]|nr:hypothetical protein [Prolixibacteraceae bacterium]
MKNKDKERMFLSEQFFLEHWMVQLSLESTLNSMYIKMEKRLKWIESELAALKQEPVKGEVKGADIKGFYPILLKHQKVNKTCLTSNEIHTFWDAMHEYASQSPVSLPSDEEIVNTAIAYTKDQCFDVKDSNVYTPTEISYLIKEVFIEGAKATRDGNIVNTKTK